MVKTCFINGCKSKSQKNCGISFFSFPKDYQLAIEWEKSIAVLNNQLSINGRSTHSKICSKHFTKDNFVKVSEKFRFLKLTANAIPTLFDVNSLSTENSFRKRRKTVKQEPPEYFALNNEFKVKEENVDDEDNEMDNDNDEYCNKSDKDEDDDSYYHPLIEHIQIEHVVDDDDEDAVAINTGISSSATNDNDVNKSPTTYNSFVNHFLNGDDEDEEEEDDDDDDLLFAPKENCSYNTRLDNMTTPPPPPPPIELMETPNKHHVNKLKQKIQYQQNRIKYLEDKLQKMEKRMEVIEKEVQQVFYGNGNGCGDDGDGDVTDFN